MSSILICNNYGQKYDGIGDYSKKIYGDIVEKVFTSNTKVGCKFSRVFDCGMTKAIIKATYYAYRNNSKNIIIEYPFVEWNPLICIPMIILKFICLAKDKKLIIGIHEYNRVNFFRKIVIIFIALIANKILVTEKANYNSLKILNKKILKIEIPSNIDFYNKISSKKTNQFIFFGMVNKAKAFQEMLEGWDLFNQLNSYKLVIVTASKLERIAIHKNVEYLYNAEDNVVAEKLLESTYAILPIRPNIDEKNATYKAACLAGCIPIGIFCEEYRKLDFIVNMEKYTKEEFYEKFKEAITLSSKNKCYSIQSYAERFSLKKAKIKMKRILKGEAND